MTRRSLVPRLEIPAIVRPATRFHKRLSDRLAYDRYLALIELGFLSEEGGISDEARCALRGYADAFLFQHTGLVVRKPNKATRDASKRGVAVPPLSYDLDKEAVGKSIMVDERGPAYWEERRRATSLHQRRLRRDASAGRSSEAEEARWIAELDRIKRAYPGVLTFPHLIRHLLADRGGDLFTQWCYLQSGPDSVVGYLVLDLDDKQARHTWPTSPSPVIVDKLRRLAATHVLDPARAAMVSSPGGLGRHLYYPLVAGARASVIFRAADGFLRWALGSDGFTGIDIFPTDRSCSTLAALPMGRGSVLCDHQGYPLPRGSALDDLKALNDAYRAASLRALDLNELALPSLASPVASSTSEGGSASPCAVDDSSGGSGHGLSPNASDDSMGVVVAGDKPVDGGGDMADERALTIEEAEILERGITARGQRYKRCHILLRAFKRQGFPIDEAVKRVQTWLRNKHNGCSEDYNANDKDSLERVELYAAGVYRMHDIKHLTINGRQVAFIVDALLGSASSNRRGLRPGSSQFFHLVQFACFMMAQIEAFHWRAVFRRDPEREERVIEAEVSATIMERFPFGTDKPRPRYLEAMSRAGLIDVVMVHDRGRATRYRVSADYPEKGEGSLPVMSAIRDYLSNGDRWMSVIACKRSWQRFRKACPHSALPIEARSPELLS